MRILWLTPEVPFPSDNGHRVVYAQRISHMASLGHEIHLRAFAESDYEIEHPHPTLQSCTESAKLFRRQTSFSFSKLSLMTPQHIAKRDSNELRKEIHDLVNSLEFDAIIIDSTNMAQYLDHILFNKKKIISVLNVHNIDYHIFWRSAIVQKSIGKKTKFALEAFKTLLYEHRLYSQNAFDIFTFVSQTELNNMKRRYRQLRAELAPIGVSNNAARLDSQKSDSPPTLVFIGNLSYFSNIESILWFVESVFPLILRRVPETKLVIAGKNPSKEILHLRGDRNIEILPDVPDAISVVWQADVVVAPMISGAGVKVKILEALSCKKTVVATDLAIEGTDLIPDKHLLVAKSLDAVNFANKCIKALLNVNNSIIAAAGYNFVIGRYDWDALMHIYDCAIIKAAAEKKRGYADGQPVPSCDQNY